MSHSFTASGLPTLEDIEFAEELASKVLNDVDAAETLVRFAQMTRSGTPEGTPSWYPDEIEKMTLEEVGRLVVFARRVRDVGLELTRVAESIEHDAVMGWEFDNDLIEDRPGYLARVEAQADRYREYIDDQLSHARALAAGTDAS